MYKCTVKDQLVLDLNFPKSQLSRVNDVQVWLSTIVHSCMTVPSKVCAHIYTLTVSMNGPGKGVGCEQHNIGYPTRALICQNQLWAPNLYCGIVE